MKLLGDVPQEHKELAIQLESMEEYLDGKAKSLLPKEMIAKGYVCLAHDWYSMGEEEIGVSLLEKAEKTYPGYFKEVLIGQTLEDSDFDRLVKSLSVQLAWVLINRVNEMAK